MGVSSLLVSCSSRTVTAQSRSLDSVCKSAFSLHYEKHARVVYTPLNPLLYRKLRFAGVYLFKFLFLLQTIDCGYSLEPPRQGGSNVYPNLCLEHKKEEYCRSGNIRENLFFANIRELVASLIQSSR